MELKLQGKTALVTGSTDGIGFAIAKLLAEEGATVSINGRTEQRVVQTIDLLKKENPSLNLLQAPFDLSEKSGVDSLIAHVPKLDILINNLGIYGVKSFEMIDDEEWFHFFNVNIMSGVRLSRYYFPLMKEQNWGRIVFISSESGVNIPSEMIHYGVTKTAQLALARGLAEITAGTNVTVNSVLPGPTYTTGVKAFVEELSKERGITIPEMEEDIFKNVRPSSLIKRFETPEEIAAVVAFVCSPLSSGINGAAIRVEGGVVRSIL